MENGWSDEAVRHDDPGPPRPVGARFHVRPEDDGPADPSGLGPGERFPVVLRGYDRRRVDERIATLTAEVERLRAEAAEGQRRWRAAHEHAADLEAQLRDGRSAPRRAADAADSAATGAADGAATGAGAGPIADRVLRHARQEAARIRAVALREADLLLDDARHAAARERRGTGEQGSAQAT